LRTAVAQTGGAEIARPDNAALDLYVKESAAMSCAIVNFEEASVAGFQHIYSDASRGCRVLVPIRAGSYQAHE